MRKQETKSLTRRDRTLAFAFNVKSDRLRHFYRRIFRSICTANEACVENQVGVSWWG